MVYDSQHPQYRQDPINFPPKIPRLGQFAERLYGFSLDLTTALEGAYERNPRKVERMIGVGVTLTFLASMVLGDYLTHSRSTPPTKSVVDYGIPHTVVEQEPIVIDNSPSGILRRMQGPSSGVLLGKDGERVNSLDDFLNPDSLNNEN